MRWRDQVGFHEQVSVVFLLRFSHTVPPPVLLSAPLSAGGARTHSAGTSTAPVSLGLHCINGTFSLLFANTNIESKTRSRSQSGATSVLDYNLAAVSCAQSHQIRKPLKSVNTRFILISVLLLTFLTAGGDLQVMGTPN